MGLLTIVSRRGDPQRHTPLEDLDRVVLDDELHKGSQVAEPVSGSRKQSMKSSGVVFSPKAPSKVPVFVKSKLELVDCCVLI